MHPSLKLVMACLGALISLTCLSPVAARLPSLTLAPTHAALIAPTGSPMAVRQSSPAPSLPVTIPQTGAQGEPRGYLTTPQELAVIAQKAAQGIEPYQSAVAQVLDYANQPWDYVLDNETLCQDAELPAWNDNDEGTPKLYARALAYHLTGQVQYAQQASDILERIMSNVLTISLKQPQCRLNFSWGTPELVASADLLETFWQGKTCIGPASTINGQNKLIKGSCKALFQNWLVKNPYFLVSYSAERSQNNWGAAATDTTAYIADYVWDRPDMKLIARDKDKEVKLTPHQAYLRARRQALDRMNGYKVDLDSVSSCDLMNGTQQMTGAEPVKSQITELGIIPEEARRDQFCNIPQYDGSYQNYPQLYLGHTIQQCELLLRRGDSTCYDNVSRQEVKNFTYKDTEGKSHTTTLRKGRGSIERAIQAIIIDSHTEWRKDSSLEVAYRYYLLHGTLPGIEQWFAQLQRPAGCSQDICFGTLTHGFAPDETPAAPPTIKAP